MRLIHSVPVLYCSAILTGLLPFCQYPLAVSMCTNGHVYRWTHVYWHLHAGTCASACVRCIHCVIGCPESGTACTQKRTVLNTQYSLAHVSAHTCRGQKVGMALAWPGTYKPIKPIEEGGMSCVDFSGEEEQECIQFTK